MMYLIVPLGDSLGPRLQIRRGEVGVHRWLKPMAGEGHETATVLIDVRASAGLKAPRNHWSESQLAVSFELILRWNLSGSSL